MGGLGGEEIVVIIGCFLNRCVCSVDVNTGPINKEVSGHNAKNDIRLKECKVIVVLSSFGVTARRHRRLYTIQRLKIKTTIIIQHSLIVCVKRHEVEVANQSSTRCNENELVV